MTYTYLAYEGNPYQLAVGVIVYDQKQDRVLVVEDRDGNFLLPNEPVRDSENLRETVHRCLVKTAGMIGITSCFIGSAHSWNKQDDYEQTTLYHLLTTPIHQEDQPPPEKEFPEHLLCWLSPEQAEEFLGEGEAQMVRRAMRWILTPATL